MKINIVKITVLILLLPMIVSQYAIGESDSEGGLEEVKGLNQKRIDLYNKGKYDEVIPYAEKVLAIQEKILGRERLDVADSLDNLAQLYRDTGQYTKAEQLYQRALKIRERIVEKDHPLIAQSYYNIAVIYRHKSDMRKQSLY